ncbi:PEP-CTERM sorting domain-containing protein [uncultured Roseibium sp.]|uniref:PEP-CTERM sorting domain-containing protein n=1 Tax=uncultured Roseibium sp. TaxID=1936171 RepID=UPI0026246562|nr:PEP-CTERM sorting domain-containing protein [uncultured Roseibium sp.]
MFRSVLAAAMLMVATSANAASISFGPTSSNIDNPTISFLNLATPTSITGDAIFTFSVGGDLSAATEHIDVSIDGFSLGRVFDNDPTNDAFNFTNDQGADGGVFSGSATIAQAVMAGLIADGLLNLEFKFGTEVNCCGPVQTLGGQIEFEEVMAVVPVPAALPLLMAGLALLGFAGWRRAS